ncbi:hypothetical protein [Herbaspirillum seropedicae]|uniref:hypothetical protein n=1 Tax=Herbaspirillum seropedicae TaxID=964 RepID=UPI003D992F30
MLDTFWMGCWRRLVDVGQCGRLPVLIATAVPRLHGDRRCMLGTRNNSMKIKDLKRHYGIHPGAIAPTFLPGKR